MISNELLIEMVNKALDKLYENDKILIQNDVHEQTIVSRFTKYFENIFEAMINDIELSVDNEYNRDILSEDTYKKIKYSGLDHKIKPDFILHKRGSNDKNILVIEFKKEWIIDTKGKKGDVRKLTLLTDLSLRYKYQLGLYIEFAKKREHVLISKYINGKNI